MSLWLYKSAKRNSAANRFRKAHGRLSGSHSPTLHDKHLWTTILRERLYGPRFTCNHTHCFLLDDDHRLWYRIGPPDIVDPWSGWKPLFWDGWPSDTPVSLSADGANLVVLDSLHEVHYRKIIKERLVPGFSEFLLHTNNTSQSPDRFKNSCREKLLQVSSEKRHACERDTDSFKYYEWRDAISDSDYWCPGWGVCFMPPFDHYMPRLNIDASRTNTTFPSTSTKKLVCCISHRGRWNRHVRDKSTGCRILEVPPGGGCTSLFCTDGDKWLRVADPFVPLGFSKDAILLPQRAADDDKSFGLECSASTVFYFCSDCSQSLSRNNEGCSPVVWKFWCMTVDYDMMGKVVIAKHYADAFTGWLLLPSLDDSSDLPLSSLQLFGSKVHNLGYNQRVLQVTFRSPPRERQGNSRQQTKDNNECSFYKCKLLVPDQCPDRQGAHWATTQLCWHVKRIQCSG